MKVRFIDTSIMLNILNVPGRNQHYEQIKDELEQAIKEGDTLILPIATIIETGNHVAHIATSRRYEVAERFSEFLLKTANGEAPWQIDESQFDKEDLVYLSSEWMKYVSSGLGLGDMSIIRSYHNYLSRVPGAGIVMIWSLDSYLKQFRKEEELFVRRRSR